MKIGIIGASLAGLTAGERLAKAGHDVTVIVNKQPIGGRLTTHYRNGAFFDYGIPYLAKESEGDNGLFDFAQNQDLLNRWATEIPVYDGNNPYKLKPFIREDECFTCEKGLSAIIDPLKRWVDIKEAKQAGGLTYYGDNRGKKRPWMINLSDYNVFECDAVILATPAVEAYGFLQTAQDETASYHLIRELDEIQYHSRFVLMGAYDHDIPDWRAIECKNSKLRWVCNESSKKGEHNDHANIAFYSSKKFAAKFKDEDEEEIKALLLDEASSVTSEAWVEQPDWDKLQCWNYYETINPIDDFYMELEMEEAPLALTGNYFKSSNIGAAYRSAIKLSDHWIEKYKDTAAVDI